MIDSTTIFSGCDSNYWKIYGASFVKSFKNYNPSINIHIHLVNPDSADIESINKLSCSYSTEFISETEFEEYYQKILAIIEQGIDKDYIKKLHTGLKFLKSLEYPDALKKIIKFSIFATSRFIQLSKIWSGRFPVIAYDIDSICLGELDIDDILKNNDAGCLVNKKGGCVASLVAFKNNSKLLYDWGRYLEKCRSERKVYGYLDQDSFNELKDLYNVTAIDPKYCKSGTKKGLVITGKGNVKHGELFISEKDKWN